MGHFFKNVKKGNASTSEQFGVNLELDGSISWGGGRLPKNIIADKNPGVYGSDYLGISWGDYDLTIPSSCTTVNDAYNALINMITDIVENQEGYDFGDYPYGDIDIDTYKNKKYSRLGKKMLIAYSRHDEQDEIDYSTLYTLHLTNNEIEAIQKVYLLNTLYKQGYINTGNISSVDLENKIAEEIQSIEDTYGLNKTSLDQTYSTDTPYYIFMGENNA